MTTGKSVGLTLTKREACLLFGMIKLAFELSQEKRNPNARNGSEPAFPMGNEALMELMPVWEKLAKDIDALNGIKESHILASDSSPLLP